MYTIKQAAARAGVSVPLLRAWERRYGIVRPIRTPSGYRLYDDQAIERVRAMRRLVDDGWAASQAAHRIETEGIPPEMAEAAEAGPGRAVAAGPLPARDDHDLAAEFVDAAAYLDERRVESVLDDLFATGSFERVVDDGLMSALRALGGAWAAGTVSVGGEHAASHAVVRRLSAAFEAAGRGASTERPVLVGLPPGSRHEIGALAFATALRRRGIGVVYLGADVPRDSWVEAARRSDARAVVIAVPTAGDVASAEDVVEAASDLDGLIVAVGGPAAPAAGLPADVLRLPDGINASAAALEEALSRPIS